MEIAAEILPFGAGIGIMIAYLSLVGSDFMQGRPLPDETRLYLLFMGMAIALGSFLCSLRIRYGRWCLIPPDQAGDPSKKETPGVRLIVYGFIVFNIVMILCIFLFMERISHTADTRLPDVLGILWGTVNAVLAFAYMKLKNSPGAMAYGKKDERQVLWSIGVGLFLVLVAVLASPGVMHSLAGNDVLTGITVAGFFILIFIVAMADYYRTRFGYSVDGSPELLISKVRDDARRAWSEGNLFISIAVFMNALFILAWHLADNGSIPLSIQKSSGFVFFVSWMTVDGVVFCAAYIRYYRNNPERDPAGESGEQPGK